LDVLQVAHCRKGITVKTPHMMLAESRNEKGLLKDVIKKLEGRGEVPSEMVAISRRTMSRFAMVHTDKIRFQGRGCVGFG